MEVRGAGGEHGAQLHGSLPRGGLPGHRAPVSVGGGSPCLSAETLISVVMISVERVQLIFLDQTT